jgi:hypothetical protein
MVQLHLSGAAITLAAQAAMHARPTPFDWKTGAVLNLVAWPVMLGWTLFNVARGMVGRSDA